MSKLVAEDIGEEFRVEVFYDNMPDKPVSVYNGSELIEDNTEEFVNILGIE